MHMIENIYADCDMLITVSKHNYCNGVTSPLYLWQVVEGKYRLFSYTVVYRRKP